MSDVPVGKFFQLPYEPKKVGNNKRCWFVNEGFVSHQIEGRVVSYVSLRWPKSYVKLCDIVTKDDRPFDHTKFKISKGRLCGPDGQKWKLTGSPIPEMIVDSPDYQCCVNSKKFRYKSISKPFQDDEGVIRVLVDWYDSEYSMAKFKCWSQFGNEFIDYFKHTPAIQDDATCKEAVMYFEKRQNSIEERQAMNGSKLKKDQEFVKLDKHIILILRRPDVSQPQCSRNSEWSLRIESKPLQVDDSDDSGVRSESSSGVMVNRSSAERSNEEGESSNPVAGPSKPRNDGKRKRSWLDTVKKGAKGAKKKPRDPYQFTDSDDDDNESENGDDNENNDRSSSVTESDSNTDSD